MTAVWCSHLLDINVSLAGSALVVTECDHLALSTDVGDGATPSPGQWLDNLLGTLGPQETEPTWPLVLPDQAGNRQGFIDREPALLH